MKKRNLTMAHHVSTLICTFIYASTEAYSYHTELLSLGLGKSNKLVSVECTVITGRKDTRL